MKIYYRIDMKIFYTLVLLLFVQLINAQYTKIYEFSCENNLQYPKGELVSDGTWMYGMTTSGGVYGLGTVFKIKPDGTGLTTLIEFNGTNGASPYNGLTLVSSVLYGVTRGGGSQNLGVLFRINTDGTGYTRLVNFDGTSFGSNPLGTLTYSGSTLYGTTNTGGSYGYGTVFKVVSDSTGFVKLYDFDGSSNGANPSRGVIISGTTLYGTTVFGGSYAEGTIFKIETNGTGFTKMLDFDNTNGSNPWSSLVLSSSVLYGSTANGGTGYGVVFKINTNGTGYSKLLEFDNNTTGAAPYGLTISGSGSILYGMTNGGGTQGMGVVFKITTIGAYTKLLDFTGQNGENPVGSVIPLGTKLVGMTAKGGNGFGAIFSINDDGTGYTKILNFRNSPLGMYPGWANFVSDGTWLYGTAQYGGLGYGVIFKIKPDGTGYTKIFEFNQTNGETPCTLILSGSTLFGSTALGGTSGLGTLFSISTSGTGFTTILNFDGTNTGSNPDKPFLSGSVLYGTTTAGGTSNLGVIYRINTNGTGFLKLLNFDGTNYGSNPNSDLVLSGTTLYGTTISGGLGDLGVIFRIETTGAGFSKILDFSGTNGSYPYSSLTLDGTSLYGTTLKGGSNNKGVIYKINTDGSNFTRLYSFDGTNGSYPEGSLALSGTRLFGSTNSGGSIDQGVFFRVNTDGNNYTKLFDFTGNANGRHSYSTPFELNGALYAQTNEGGLYDVGTIFKYDLKPPVCGTISGLSSVCEGQEGVTYSVPVNPDAELYSWTLPGAVTGSSTTNSITVNFTRGSTSGNISVKAFNSYGEGPLSTIAVTVSPLPVNPASITGSSSVYFGQSDVSYSVTAINNATSYSWNYSGTGATITGSGSNIKIGFSATATSGNLTVMGTNACGNGTVSAVYPITVGPKPHFPAPVVASITQPTCKVPTGSVILNNLPLEGTWTLTRNPGGTSTGTGTTLTVSALDPGTYTFSVTNALGDISDDAVVVLDPIKTGIVPFIKAKWNDMLICYNLKDSIASYQWYKDNAAITNATSQFYVTGKTPGSYKVETIDKESCRNFSNSISLTGTKSIYVYPNPASASFALKIEDEIEKGAVVTISNSSGVKFLEINIENTSKESLKNIPINDLPEGIYFVRVLIDNKNSYSTKIVVVK
jgi:uncharacterized repeat protein (TIGR03803 family)